MSSLTGDFLKNREKSDRYRRFLLPGAVLLLVAGSVAAGFYLLEKSEQKSPNAVEASSQTLPREWLLKYFGVGDERDGRVGGLEGDPDADILTNEQEFFFGTDPGNADSDGDGQGDGAEVAVNSNPLGAGELYSTEFAKQLTDKYLEARNLPEFKNENIQKQVVALLNPPDLAKVQLKLDDPKTLRIGKDNSPEAVAEYLQALNEAAAGMDVNEQNLQAALADPNDPANAVSPGQIYETINRIREISVPSDFLRFHQLHIAGLFAAANIFEIARTIDPEAELEKEQPKIQEQYYQVAVIQKADLELKNEVGKLAEKYKNEIDQFPDSARTLGQ